MFKKIFLSLITLFIIPICFSQTTKPKLKGWHLLSAEKDGYYGIGLTDAYDLLKNKKSTTVIVAVIDSGIDTLHEDLKSVLWMNTKEVSGNGKDDDNNGYTDDVHGWNFCGASNGENLATNTHEVARVYHNWKKEFADKKEKEINADRKFLYQQWKRAELILNKQYKNYKDNFTNIDLYHTVLTAANRLLTTQIDTTAFNKYDIQELADKKDSVGWAANVWLAMFIRANDLSVNNIVILKEIESMRNNLLNNKKRMEDTPVDFRGALTKDKYEDITDKIYGNNNLQTGCGHHGTHVAGIIAAIRNNNIGMDGIADNVRIMALRAVPGGDEHDKDVALAIRYAVDNGATIINMSFGKPVSPYKKFVDEAIKYAAKKGVLLVHGAGNDAENIDKEIFYPYPIFLDGTKATNYLTVGASGDYSTGSLTANFSNYGKVVDIFSPGVYIYSTVTGGSYEAYDGTSMASPVAAGTCALLKSYFPLLTPAQIIDILIKSGTAIKEEVLLPGSTKKIALSKLCNSGKIINAYEAVKLALAMEKK